MTTNIERARLVSRHVQIESVVLADTKMKATLHSIEEPMDLRLGQQFRCRCERRESHPNQVFVYVELEFEANPVGEIHTEPSVVDLSATFLATYRLESAGSYPADALRHFADLNGTYNVWPYWRELVQNFAARAGLSSIVVPVFKPPIRPIPTQEELALAGEAAALGPADPTSPAAR